MRTHDLSRSQRLALTIILAIAILLPLAVVFPTYIDWQTDEKSQDVVSDAAANSNVQQ